ncbi:MAG: C40 family peptidase [Clostridium sp.]|nr:C40 family peptidase [Bacteroides sp.]MCM1198133.1 C40 family peptidase [Clostridium sp.]
MKKSNYTIKIFLATAAIAYSAIAAAQQPLPESMMQNDGDIHGKRYAVVNLSVNFLREAPDYTAELGTQALMGTTVEIIGENGYWRQVVTPEPYTAWCTDLGIVEMSPEKIREYIESPKYICTAWHSTVYPEPSDSHGKICDIVEGDLLRMGGRNVKGFSTVLLPDGTKGYVRKRDVVVYSQWTASRHAGPEDIIDEAYKFIGVPYLWGGASPNGVDCSGFVRHVFMMNGTGLPRNASQQAREGSPVEVEWRTGNAGKSPVTEHFRKGDLLFFGRVREDGTHGITHVGIYIGGGRFIHSSQYVRISSLDPEAEDYYENTPRLLECRRILK